MTAAYTTKNTTATKMMIMSMIGQEEVSFDYMYVYALNGICFLYVGILNQGYQH